jgi:hypothetical protein
MTEQCGISRGLSIVLWYWFHSIASDKPHYAVSADAGQYESMGNTIVQLHGPLCSG